ncbi:Hypothetical predicted protein [Podarcis lilfordi]|uniref:Uncharacterized protein n=1 Tax=Podarcis lilfordi TaxID=74358 RepID=A0AA35K6J2_9SAUR|nr:Hypothetical predicted protein [Podarcis lilfordi]
MHSRRLLQGYREVRGPQRYQICVARTQYGLCSSAFAFGPASVGSDLGKKTQNHKAGGCSAFGMYESIGEATYKLERRMPNFYTHRTLGALKQICIAVLSQINV